MYLQNIEMAGRISKVANIVNCAVAFVIYADDGILFSRNSLNKLVCRATRKVYGQGKWQFYVISLPITAQQTDECKRAVV